MKDSHSQLSETIAKIALGHDQIEPKLRSVLAQQPDNIASLYRLGEIYRQKGELAAAADYFQKVLSIDASHQPARNVLSVLNQTRVDTADNRISESGPVRFVLNDDFLNVKQLDTVWEELKTNYQCFKPSKVNGREQAKGKINPDVRSSLIMNIKSIPNIHAFFLDQIKQQLSDILPKIGLEPFDIGKEELQLTMHGDGDHFRIHRDNEPYNHNHNKNSNRLVTFVYYFYRRPRAFSGGDLILHDSEQNSDGSSSSFTRIKPEHNSVLFFPSDAYHEVIPVQLDSTDYRDSRFTLNGWFHPVSSD